MKIVLTGAGGFIAQNLIKHLLKKDQIKIKAFLNKKTKVIKHENIKYYIKKIENITSKDLKGYQALFHFVEC